MVSIMVDAKGEPLAPLAFEESRLNSIKGLSYMALSAFLFSVMTLLVKVAGNSGVPPIHVVGVRLGCQAVLAALAGSLYFRVSPLGPPNKRKLLWMRGFAGSTSVALFFWGLTKLPLSDATVLFFTNPIIAAIVARFMLGEKWGYFEAGAACVSLVGVSFISRPQFLFGPPPLPDGVTLSEEVEMEELHFEAVLACLGASVATSFAIVMVRQLGPSVHFICSVFYLGMAGAITSALVTLYTHEFTQPSELSVFEMLCVGLVGFAAQCALTRGLQLEKTGPAALMRNLDILCSLVYQVTLLREEIDVHSLFGAMLVMGATSSMVMRRIRQAGR